MPYFTFRQAIIFGLIFASAALIGYDSGYLNGVIASEDFNRRYGPIGADGKHFLLPLTRSLFTSMLIVGTVFGCLIPSFVQSRIGRKGCLLVAGLIYTLGVALQTAGVPAAGFIVGRVFLGVGLGIISVTSPGYLIEASSSKSRGRLIALYTQLLTSGNVVACAISLGTAETSGSMSWRLTIAFQLVLALFVFLGACYAPESPTILMRQGQHERAHQSICALRNIQPGSSDLSAAIEEIQQWIDQQEVAGKVRPLECFQGTNRRRTLLGITMSFMTIATGVTFWFGYGTTFFQSAGVDNAFLVSLILAVVNCIFTSLSVYLTNKLGRRNMLHGGAGVMIGAYLVVGVTHSVAPNSAVSNNMLIAGAILFIAAYAATWGTLGWTIMTEPYSSRLRTQSTSITMVTYWTATWGVGFATPYLVDETAADLGVNIVYLWLGMAILSLVWAYLCVPELSGLSIREVDALFEQRISARKSKEWARQLRDQTEIEGIDVPGGAETLHVRSKDFEQKV